MNVALVPENKLEEGWLDPRSKLNAIQSTIGTHKTVVYGPMIDWKTKKRLDYMWDVCDTLVVSRPWKCLFTIIFY